MTPAEAASLARRRRADRLFHVLAFVATTFGVTVLAVLVWDVVGDGAPRLSWQFLTSYPSRKPAEAGILSALVGSIWMLSLTAMIAFPIGVATAIYLEEYAPQGRLSNLLEINISNLAHPMHLHGGDFTLIAKDGEPIRPNQQQTMNTLSIDAGETYDIAFRADNPGTWVFHCHELHHTENDGVEPGGLIQVIQYEGYTPPTTGEVPAGPTAMPEEPLTRRLGKGAGRTVGSSVVSSKLGMKSTVSLSRSAINSSASASRRASVYRYAAGGSPSTEPKFPWPSTRG